MSEKQMNITCIADGTSDAYSFDRYGPDNWRNCVELLMDRGYNDREVEAVLRSKYMRWTGDQASKDSDVTRKDLEAFIEKCPDLFTPTQLMELVAGTF